METKANENKECEFFLAKKENGCKRHPVVDPETNEFLGFVACRVFDKCPLKNKKEIFATAEETRNAILKLNKRPPLCKLTKCLTPFLIPLVLSIKSEQIISKEEV